MEKQTMTVEEAYKLQGGDYHFIWYWEDINSSAAVTIERYGAGYRLYVPGEDWYEDTALGSKPIKYELTEQGRLRRQRDIATATLRALCDSDTIEAWCADNGISINAEQQLRTHLLVEHIARTVLARMDDKEADA